MTKTYILDTSALINYPDIISSIKGHNVVIPSTVIRQLDYLKNSSDENVVYCSRRASQSIEKYQRMKNVTITKDMVNVNMLNSGADNQIVGTGICLKNKGHNVCLLSTDRNMRIAARAYGVEAKTGDDRERKENIWKFITWAVFSVPMLSILLPCTGIKLSKYISDYLPITAAVGFVITFIPVIMMVYYSNRSRPSYSEDSIYDDTTLNPEYGPLYYDR
ncbi:MAG: PIN domain-containing protein [Deltaproteobacteria bacterium]